MNKIFSNDAVQIVIKMSKQEKHTLKQKAYGNLQTVSEFVRQELCQ